MTVLLLLTVKLKGKVTLYTVKYYNLKYSLQNPWLSDNYCTFIEIYNLDLNDVNDKRVTSVLLIDSVILGR